MDHIQAKVERKINLLTIIGPASVILSILALIVKESPFYIDLSAIALIGFFLAWRLKGLGLLLASALLSCVLSYDYFFDVDPLTLWDVGLALSLEIAFVVTTFASKEMKEVFQRACRATAESALVEIEEWKEKIAEISLGKQTVVQELEALKSKLLPLQDRVKENAERAECFERLLEMARNELQEKSKEQERFSQLYYDQKISCRRLEDQFDDAKGESESKGRLIQQLEEELKTLTAANSSNEGLLHKKSMEVLDLEWKLEKMQEELQLHKSKASSGEEKLQDLGEKMEGLIDELKNLQSEKDALEKALEAALNPPIDTSQKTSNRELSRVQGLYNQLRSQFSEKSQTLDETRSALFKLQEEFALFQKNKQEEQQSEQEAFESYIVELNETIERLEKELAFYT